jgi:hypothetical protein
MDDIEKKIENLMPHKIGDIVNISHENKDPKEEWVVTKYLIGGYEIKSRVSGEIFKVETRYVNFAELDLNKIEGHEKHMVVISYVSNPNFDSYIYCRDCKKELKTNYKKLPKPSEVHFYGR